MVTAPPIKDVSHLRIVGSVVLFTLRTKHIFLKTFLSLVSSIAAYTIVSHLLARGKYALEDYEIMSNDKNLHAEYKWKFPFLPVIFHIKFKCTF